LRIGIEPGVRLAPEGLRWQLALRVVRSWAGRLDVDVQPSTVADRLRQLYDELADHLTDRSEVRAAHAALRTFFDDALAAGKKPTKRAREALRHAEIRDQLLALVESYEQAKREHQLLDHGDQIALAARLATLKAVRDVERRQFPVVLLDEYQDTNVAQRILLQRLFGDGHPVTAVGDPAQSIYAFRGASVSNIVRFPEQFPGLDGEPAHVFPLSTNFRSGGRILAAANRISAGLDRVGSVDPPTLVPRPGREASGEGGGSVTCALLPDVEAEADWVAERLLDAARARQVPSTGLSCDVRRSARAGTRWPCCAASAPSSG
jgi:DNA helicase-2/ATP-dependent DNA helicase PcrA